MKNDHLNRVVAAALSAASVGAVAGVAQEADAQSLGQVAPITTQINWGPLFAGGGDWFAEYHQSGYERELDMVSVSNWNNVFVGIRP